jgi:hypothetical protein
MMSDEEVLGAGGCVNWTTYDVPQIWAMLEPENEWINALQAAAWNRTFDLLDSHRIVLEKLRRDLSSRWSPETSQAAAVYLTQLDRLIDSITTTSHAASGNALGLSAIADSLLDAKAAIRPLRERWQRDAASRDTLRDQTRRIMASADAAVYDHAQRLTMPPDFLEPRRMSEATQSLVPAAETARSSQSTAITHERLEQAGGRTRDLVDDPLVITDTGWPIAGQLESQVSLSALAKPDVPQPTDPIENTYPTIQAPSPIIGRQPPTARYWSATRTPTAPVVDKATQSDDPASRIRPETWGSSYPDTNGEVPWSTNNGSVQRRDSRQRSGRLPCEVSWETRHGVSPVLEPPPAPDRQSFAPGPGVIGIEQ